MTEHHRMTSEEAGGGHWPDEDVTTPQHGNGEGRGLLEERHTHPVPPDAKVGAPPAVDAVAGGAVRETLNRPRATATGQPVQGQVVGRTTRTAASAGAQGASDDTGGKMFSKLADMKSGKQAVETALAEQYDVRDFYKDPEFSPISRIARSGPFEHVTLGVIAFNAIWIGVDADHNGADTIDKAQKRFQLMENFFCIYFTGEVCIRFMAFQNKCNALKDGWFKFDGTLVSMMVLETWIMPIMLAFNSGESQGPDVGMLSIFRLLRLLRLTRMVRLMRAVPELVTLIKGMAAAMRSVFSTLTLLILNLYVFAIVFKSMYGDAVEKRDCDEETQTVVGPDEEFEPEPACMWNSIPKSMMMLFFAGTLLDNITSEAAGILEKENLLVIPFLLYVLISSFTILNMLIGVLCEVVSSVANDENEKAMILDTKQRLETVISQLQEADTDGDRMVSKTEFQAMLDNPEVMESLKAIGVEAKHNLALTSVLFDNDDVEEAEADEVQAAKDKAAGFDVSDEKAIGFSQFVETIVRLRPAKTASVMDVAELRHRVRADIKKTNDEGKASLDGVMAKQKRVEEAICTIAERVGTMTKRLKEVEAKVFGAPLGDDAGVGHT